ncbi:MAG: hypothetical protein N5P05_002053 [Chroococcopsis gigantea SAG 12.99]|jgi:hypothetical protein|nr:DUF1816 domain-containing protein [Chlorogloea purpurea SAG 13.99]MDV3000447.1 hypothetical protein [Chroococcopsis gigantea SAG 12.99]
MRFITFGLFAFLILGFILQNLRLSRLNRWWVKIDTKSPDCTYYFGPFDSSGEAHAHESGYREDLEKEGAIDMTVTIKRCNPPNLTIDRD